VGIARTHTYSRPDRLTRDGRSYTIPSTTEHDLGGGGCNDRTPPGTSFFSILRAWSARARQPECPLSVSPPPGAQRINPAPHTRPVHRHTQDAHASRRHADASFAPPRSRLSPHRLLACHAGGGGGGTAIFGRRPFSRWQPPCSPGRRGAPERIQTPPIRQITASLSACLRMRPPWAAPPPPPPPPPRTPRPPQPRTQAESAPAQR